MLVSYKLVTIRLSSRGTPGRTRPSQSSYWAFLQRLYQVHRENAAASSAPLLLEALHVELCILATGRA